MRVLMLVAGIGLTPFNSFRTIEYITSNINRIRSQQQFYFRYQKFVHGATTQILHLMFHDHVYSPLFLPLPLTSSKSIFAIRFNIWEMYFAIFYLLYVYARIDRLAGAFIKPFHNLCTIRVRMAKRKICAEKIRHSRNLTDKYLS